MYPLAHQVTSNPTRASSAASAAISWAISTKSSRARHPANFCPSNTQRHIGVLDGASRSSCQCKEGAISATSPRWLACACICGRRFQRALPSQGTTTRDSRPARFVALAIDRCRALPAMRIRLASGFAGVCEMYEGARACAGCVAVGRAHASCLVWSRPYVREQVQSAFHVLAG
jgi:hypothetical protein